MNAVDAVGGAVRWGILATGRITEALVAAAASTPSAVVEAVGSRDERRAAAFAKARSIPRGHGSYEALVADPEIDAVYVATPNALHVPWTLRALEAGKHVLCEKPMSADPAQVEALYEAAARAGRVVMEAFMYRHHPQTARMARLVREGAVGRPALIRASFGFLLEGAGDVRLRHDLDGGALMDVGCYCVNAARLLAGAEPVRAFGVARTGGDGVDVRLVGTLEFPDGLAAQLECWFDLPPGRGIEVVGTEGTLLAHDPWFGGRLELRRHGGREDLPGAPVDAYRLELENMAAAIRGEAAPLLGRDDALGQARTLAALHRSARTGAAVAVEGG